MKKLSVLMKKTDKGYYYDDVINHDVVLVKYWDYYDDIRRKEYFI